MRGLISSKHSHEDFDIVASFNGIVAASDKVVV